jgi:tRNA(Ile)-lysidine synthase TilS/MesJ
MQDILNSFTSLVRKGVDEYHMIENGDAIAVGISGGKDSLMLLMALRHLQRFYPKRFTLRALTVELGFPEMDFAPVAALCEELEVPYTRVKTDIREIVFDVREEENPCSLCAKMRRGALNTALKELGCGKLALGHHFDDAVETFAMNLLIEGRLGCFKPVTYLSRMDVTQIRPMIYCGEKKIANTAAQLGLPVVKNPCPMDTTSKRHEIKALLQRLSADCPDLRSKIFGAMQRLPLEGWSPDKARYRKEERNDRN